MPRQPKRGAVDRERKRRVVRTRRHRRRQLVARQPRAAAGCGGRIEIKTTGRIPKWCSAACRQRAWEQSRAAASGRSAVEVVERVVEVPVEREHTPRREEWPTLLRQLTAQLDDGRIYARDLPDLSTALADLVAAFNRRQAPRHLRR